MCGINGIAYAKSSGRVVDPAALVRMRDAIAHRGPDDEGIYIHGNIGLGHRRLSIVDLSSGKQPMFSEDRSCVIVYNGEVYNHSDHVQGLKDLGYKYHSASDTETILHLYEEYGANCVSQLRGMFAFAIWDKACERLFIARDRFGVKPLYYYLAEDGSFYFASEIKSLLASGCVSPQLNFAALPDQLANHGTSGDETLFAGVRRLLPGHTLFWQDGRVTISEYWDLEFEPKAEIVDEEEVVAEWYDRFREAVRLRLMSDVPLGMFLSGGIDSSAIAAVMSELADGPVKTFSVGFAEQEANEFRYARLVAERFRTDHHEVTITPEDFFSALPKLVWHEDEPLGFEASVPLYFVSKLAQHHVKVVLTGEGSDETLAGYGRYRKALSLLQLGRKYEAITPGLVRGAVRSGVAVLPSVLNRKLDRTFLTRDADIQSIYFDNFSVFRLSHLSGLLSRNAIERTGTLRPYDEQNRWLVRCGAVGLLDQLLYVDTKTYLHELLMKQDQMSMAASIESRVPFLDHKLVEFSSRLPDRMKLRGGDSKWILRRAMKDVLPSEILHRPKMGFPVPLGSWLKGRFRHVIDEYILNPRSLERGLFKEGAVRRLVAEHEKGEDHTSRLFRLINLEIWHRIFIDGEEFAG